MEANESTPEKDGRRSLQRQQGPFCCRSLFPGKPEEEEEAAAVSSFIIVA